MTVRAAILAGAVAGAAVLGLSGALAQGGGMSPPPTTGYLADPQQTLRLLPPPPAAGSTREADDEAIYDKTRAIKDADPARWTLAAQDSDMSQGVDLFDCALGMRLGDAQIPALKLLFKRVARDAKAVVDPPKDFYDRPRPYVKLGGPICVDKDPSLAVSPSYPSGHSTQSWAWGLILAELAPDRAVDILMRARAIGESRVVCGVHYASDVEAGRTNGAALVAALHGDPAFRADLETARAELAAARQTPHVGADDCLATDQAAAHPPY